MPPETMRKPSAGQRRGQGPGVADDLGRVLPELRLGRLPEGHRLGRDDVLQRAALQTRERPPCRWPAPARLGAEDGAAPRAPQRLVGREGDDVGHADRVGMDPAGDEPGHVGGVEEEQGTHLVGDAARSAPGR